MNSLSYKGYTAQVEYDEDDRIFVGHLAGIDDIVGFHGMNTAALEQAFHEAVDSYLAISDETGRPAQSPYTGELTLHISPAVHAAVVAAAEGHGKSIDQWAAEVLERAAGR